MRPANELRPAPAGYGALGAPYEVDLNHVHQYLGNPSTTGLGKLPVTFIPAKSRDTLRP